MSQSQSQKKYGFTFLELIFAIAIIVMIAGSILNIRKSGICRENFIRTKAEMSSIASLLEQYYEKYGDYPRIDIHDDSQGNVLCAALQGKTDPFGNDINEHNLLSSDFSISEDGYLLDSFGNKYIYLYKTKNNPKLWKKKSYILISLGIKGATHNSTTIHQDSIIDTNGNIDMQNSSDLILTNTGFL